MKSQSRLKNRVGLWIAAQISRLPKNVQQLLALTLTFGIWILLLPAVTGSIQRHSTYDRLMREGTVTTGTVTDGPGSKNHPLRYDFQVSQPDGTLTNIHAAELTGDNLQWLKPGDRIYLRYDPKYPSISWVDGNTVIPNDYLFLTPLFIVLSLTNLLVIAAGVLAVARAIKKRRTPSA